MLSILKMGGAAITDKKGYERAKPAAIRVLARAAAKALSSGSTGLIIVHGAGSFGHPQVIKYGIRKGVRTKRQKIGFRKTQESVAKLSTIVMRELLHAKVPAVLFPTYSLLSQRRGRISHFNLAPVKAALKAGLVPVMSGDMVSDSALGGSVCSGDQVISYLCSKLKIARTVFATDVDGVFTADPKKNKKAKLFTSICLCNLRKLRGSLGSSRHADVTGGMKGKLAELAGIKSNIYVANASKPDRIHKLLTGKKALSTRIR